MLSWRILFAFKNTEILICELEHLNQAENPDKSKRFQWLRIDLIANSVYPLSFVAMQDSQDQQYRKFDAGELYFTSSEAKFSSAPTIEYLLEPVNVKEAEQQFDAVIEQWLSS